MTDAENGRNIFIQHCAFCHTLEKGGGDVFGPNLYQLFGRKIGSKSGFKYSSGYANKGILWTEQTLDVYLESTSRFIPSTVKPNTMIKDPKERKDLIAYLKEATCPRKTKC